MKYITKETLTGERALYNLKEAIISECVFMDGESPLKESRDITVNHSVFKWKYPVWYSQNIIINNSSLFSTARSGIWHSKNIEMNNCLIYAPKIFRRCDGLVLNNVTFFDAKETLWFCKNIKLTNVKAKGDYLGINSEDIEVDHLELDGNYLFDGGKNIVVRNSTLKSKDSFWNCENVTVYDSFIKGEYIGWNSKNLTFVNCKIESHQGFCYIKGLKLVNCTLANTDLSFEFCEDIDAEIVSEIDSVKNPLSGIIKAKKINELILDEQYVDLNKIEIKVSKDE